MLRRLVAAIRPLPSSAVRRRAPDDPREEEEVEGGECVSRCRPSDTSPSSTLDTTDTTWASADGDDDGADG